jgi:hypothetical protein
MPHPEVTGRKFIGKRDVGARYGGVVPRTIDRWIKAGILPAPDLIIRNRPYWDQNALDRHDRHTVAARAAAQVPAAEPASNEEQGPQSAA